MDELTMIARSMSSALRLTGQPQEAEITADGLRQAARLILRYHPDDRLLQLVTVCWNQQPSNELRLMLRQAFDVPPSMEATFDYVNGYGIMKLTWPAEMPEPCVAQLSLFDPPAEASIAAYREV